MFDKLKNVSTTCFLKMRWHIHEGLDQAAVVGAPVGVSYKIVTFFSLTCGVSVL